MTEKILAAFLVNLSLSIVFVYYCYIVVNREFTLKFWYSVFGLTAAMTCIHLLFPGYLPLKQYPLRFLFMLLVMKMPWDSSLVAIFLFYFMTDPIKRDTAVISKYIWGVDLVLNPVWDTRISVIFLLLSVGGTGIVFVTSKWLRKMMECKLSRKIHVMLCGYCMLMSAVYYIAGHDEQSMRILVLINCVGISCVFALLAFFEYQNEKRIETEHALVEQAMRFENEKILARQEYSDILMHRLHDFKKELPHLLKGQELMEETTEISELIESFDRLYDTGNPYLDSVLNDKAVTCHEHQIKLLCILDGHLFDFMRPRDLISLFANAIDNAIEAVMKIQEGRSIQVKCSKTGGFMYLSFQNPYDGMLFEGDNGLQTSKIEFGHGYGLKSIRHIAEKYNGQISIKSENKYFQLVLIFPNTENYIGN